MEMKLLAYIRSTLGRAHHARRGQSLVEFALVAPLFFLLVFGVIDFGRLFFTKVTLQHALREAGRYAVTGQKQATFNRCQSIRNIAQKSASGLLTNPGSISIEAFDSQGNLDAAHCAGRPGETVVVSLQTDLTLITPLIGRYFPNGVYTFKVSTSFKNEPFDLSETD